MLFVSCLVEALLDEAEASYARNADWRALLVGEILLAEELDQVVLLEGDARVEELPRGERVEDHADRIGEHDLRADGPVEPAEVARVADEPIDAARDQLVALLLALLHVVVEVGARRVHGQLAKALAEHDKRQTGPAHATARLERRPEPRLECELEPAGQGRHAVLPAVVEQKGVGGRLALVEGAREHELADMKEAQRHQVEAQRRQTTSVTSARGDEHEADEESVCEQSAAPVDRRVHGRLECGIGEPVDRADETRIGEEMIAATAQRHI